MARNSEETRKIDKFIGKRLYNLRLKARMSRRGLSEIMGVSYQQITKYETGANRLSVSRMFLIANALGIKPESFYEGLEEYLASDTDNNEIHSYNHNHQHIPNVSIRSEKSDLGDTKYPATNLSNHKFTKQVKKSSSKRLLKLRTCRNPGSHDGTDKNDMYGDEYLNLECA